MYDTQWKCDINKNVLKIILLVKEHNKIAKYVDIIFLLWFYLPSPGDFCVGLGVQAGNETARKLKFNIPVFVGSLLGPSVLGKESLKDEPNYFPCPEHSLKVLHSTGI